MQTTLTQLHPPPPKRVEQYQYKQRGDISALATVGVIAAAVTIAVLVAVPIAKTKENVHFVFSDAFCRPCDNTMALFNEA